MTKKSYFLEKTNLYRLVTSVLLILILNACDNATRTKNVQRYPKNSQPNGPQKPTPSTGLHTPGYVAFDMIAIKQAARALDIVLNKSNSMYVHACQKLTTSLALSGQPNTQPSLTTEIIQLTSHPQDCKKSKNKREGESWSALENFKVSYSEGQRGQSKQLEAVKKDEDSRPINIERQVARHEANTNLNLSNEKIEFTRLNDGSLQFSYSARLTLSQTETRLPKITRAKAKNKNPNANKNDLDDTIDENDDAIDENLEENNIFRDVKKIKKTIYVDLATTGFVNISNNAQFLWTLTQSSQEFERLTNDRTEIHTILQIVTGESTQNLTTYCGLPVGQFGATQNVEIAGQSYSYSPVFIISPAGVISTPDYQFKFQTKTCAASARDGLRGFQDLLESVLLAEKITAQPSRPPKNNNNGLSESIEP